MSTDPTTSIQKITMLRWHIERYDRLRTSTATRAAVVLSAGALLSAANAVIISQVLALSSRDVPLAPLLVCALIVLSGSALLVLSVLRAIRVLVTVHDSRTMFDPADTLPASPLFNGTDTVRHVRSFDDFSALVDGQTDDEVSRAATTELWIGIHQHRHRYQHLRAAVRLLGYASIVIPLALACVLIVNLANRG